MADISQELIIISNGRYGRDIRQAIYDALRKVNSGGGGGGGGDLSDYYTKEEVDEKLILYVPTSAIPNLTQAIAQNVLQDVSETYYDKETIDTTLTSYVPTTAIPNIAQGILQEVATSYYTKTQVDSLIASIDSMPHVVCTQAEYDAMAEHDTDTLYFVKGEISATLYLGDLPVNTGGGSSTPNTTGGSGLYSSGPINSVAGTNEEG